MQKIPEVKFPRSPYVAVREELDGGFSQGWGFHFTPNEQYWVDAHTHLRGVTNLAELTDVLNRWFYHAEAYRLGRVTAFVEDEALFGACGAVASADPRFSWFYWPDWNGKLENVKHAFDCGAVGLKLHNSEAMRGNFDPAVWENDEWSKIFEFLNDRGAAVNWHVTQRVSYSPYHGGGDNAYWSDGAKNGVKFDNRDLLAQFLRVADSHPNIAMIGAHQLYVSNAALAELFAKHKNVHVDTSVGYFLRWADQLHPEDAEIYRDFVVEHGDRLLFGTDSMLTPASIDPYLVESWKCHARFIMALRLPNETLQAVAHGNAERLFRLNPCGEARKYSTRP